MNRRTLLQSTLGFATALAPLLATGGGSAKPAELRALRRDDALSRLSAVPGFQLQGREQIAMLLYPGFTALDLVGPHYFFGSMMGATVHLVTNQRDLAPVKSDLGLAVAPTITIEDCPREIDLLFAPGGTDGTLAAMEDQRTLGFFTERADHASYITSVCTGSLILAAAGLLKGKRATSHWCAISALESFGAVPTHERVVTDGKCITGAGVSAGLDFALAVVAEVRGKPYAEALMLQGEYQPKPPFAGGSLDTTPPEIAEPLQALFSSVAVKAEAIAARNAPFKG